MKIKPCAFEKFSKQQPWCRDQLERILKSLNAPEDTISRIRRVKEFTYEMNESGSTYQTYDIVDGWQEISNSSSFKKIQELTAVLGMDDCTELTVSFHNITDCDICDCVNPDASSFISQR